MQYLHPIVPGVFHARPNRFIAHIEIGGNMEVCHVKNTGRCRELLSAGAQVYCADCLSPARKTRYDLIAVQKGIVIAAGWSGKVKTASTMVGLCAMMAVYGIPQYDWVQTVVMWVIVITTVYSGGEYFLHNWRCLKDKAN